jgi:hypothetical protein
MQVFLDMADDAAHLPGRKARPVHGTSLRRHILIARQQPSGAVQAVARMPDILVYALTGFAEQREKFGGQLARWKARLLIVLAGGACKFRHAQSLDIRWQDC